MADKPPASVQYNRPVTKARPQDPRRFESHDVLSADAQQDPVYQKMVQDIEALQQRQGWLAGRGAFDKDDLLYLKHKQDEERLKEHEQRESEAAAFAAARARAAQMEQEAARTTLKQSLRSTKPGAKTSLLQPLVKVKAHSRDHAVLDRQQGQLSEDLPGTKRPKLAARDSPADNEPLALHSTSKVAAGPTLSDPAVQPAAQGKSGIVQQSQQQGICSSAERPTIQQQPQQSSGGLAGLLGGYGSDDDNSEGFADSPSNHNTHQQTKEQSSRDAAKQLPSAAQMLESELPDGSFAEAYRQQLEAAVGAAQENAAAATSDVKPIYRAHGSWV